MMPCLIALLYHNEHSTHAEATREILAGNTILKREWLTGGRLSSRHSLAKVMSKIDLILSPNRSPGLSWDFAAASSGPYRWWAHVRLPKTCNERRMKSYHRSRN
jgi:hypothetical protein